MQYLPFSTFIFRCPTLPLSNLNNVLKSQDALLEYLSLPNISEAIFIASPVLFEELQKLQTGKIKDKENEEQIILSCTRYIERMSTRCTPFGTFAGLGIGSLNDKTNIVLSKSIKKNVRLDMFLFINPI
ncbi:MAG: lantibiotic dehydratase [Paludibacteraceae bacterium]